MNTSPEPNLPTLGPVDGWEYYGPLSGRFESWCRVLPPPVDLIHVIKQDLNARDIARGRGPTDGWEDRYAVIVGNGPRRKMMTYMPMDDKSIEEVLALAMWEARL